MDVTPLIRSDLNIIQRYGADGFRVSGQNYTGGVLVTADAVTPWSFSGNPMQITLIDLEPLFSMVGSVDVVLLGMGKVAPFLLPDVRRALKEKGLAIDVMDTGAACRTYNVLIAEGRRVAAALLPT